MTFAELKARLNDHAGETVIDAEAGRIINASYFSVLDKGKWKRQIGTTTVAATTGTAEFTLGASIEEIESIQNGASTRMYKESLRNYNELYLGSSNSTTAPTTWAESGTDADGNLSFFIYPVTSTADTLSLRYWKRPTELSASTEAPALPAEKHYLIENEMYARWDARKQAATATFMQQQSDATMARSEQKDGSLVHTDTE